MNIEHNNFQFNFKSYDCKPISKEFSKDKFLGLCSDTKQLTKVQTFKNHIDKNIIDEEEEVEEEDYSF